MQEGKGLVGWIKARAALAVFVAVYVAVFGFFALRQGNIEFLLYTVAMLGYIAVVLALDARVHLSRLVLWCMALWGLTHMAGGTVPIPASVQDGDKAVLYAMRVVDWLPRYDQVVHAFGFFSATLVCGEALRAGIVRQTNKDDSSRRLSFGLAAGAALMGMGLGAFNEVIEFVMTLVLPETGVGGYTNTGWDLVSNMVGAAVGGLVCWRRK
jgi:predicted membrane protein DUF2238